MNLEDIYETDVKNKNSGVISNLCVGNKMEMVKDPYYEKLSGEVMQKMIEISGPEEVNINTNTVISHSFEDAIKELANMR